MAEPSSYTTRWDTIMVEKSVRAARRATLMNEDDFAARFDVSANEILRFVEDCGIFYSGAEVLDVGSGDGAVDLGVAVRSGAILTGIDIICTDLRLLLDAADFHGVEGAKEAKLRFVISDDKLDDIQDGSIDHAFSRDVIEHVFNPIDLFSSVHRKIKSGGTFFIQAWPLWNSEWGAHLFNNIKPFDHLFKTRETILERADHPAAVVSYDSCCRMTVDDLQRSLHATGFRPLKVELVCPTFSIPDGVQHLSWSAIGIAGVKVLARRL